jgi:hypothetical protein
MIVSGEAWRLFKETHPERDFSDFWLEVSLKFSMNYFDLSSFFLLREDYSPTDVASSSSKILKTEPLSPITTGLDFTYASDVVEKNSRDLGHILELSYSKMWIPNVIVIIPYRNFYATTAIKTFFLRKNVTLPHLAVLHEKISRQIEDVRDLS